MCLDFRTDIAQLKSSPMNLRGVEFQIKKTRKYAAAGSYYNVSAKTELSLNVY